MDKSWFGDIYTKYYSKMIKGLKSKGLNQEQSEDVINDTVITLLSNPNLVQSGAVALFTSSVNFNSHLKPINVLGITQYPRKLFNQNASYLLFEAATQETPETALATKQFWSHFDQMINILPKGQRQLINDRLAGKPATSCRYAYSLLRKTLSSNIPYAQELEIVIQK